MIVRKQWTRLRWDELVVLCGRQEAEQLLVLFEGLAHVPVELAEFESVEERWDWVRSKVERMVEDRAA